MPLFIYTIEQSSEWDRVVKSFASYDIYYLSGYVKAFKIHGDGEPILFYYEDKNLRGINVVMKRDIADDFRFSEKLEKGKYFDFITPYGYGGWLVEGCGDTTKLFDAYERWCQENNIVSEFVRYHPILNNCENSKPFYDVVMLGGTIAMDLSSQEVIWENLTSKNRNMVRKAIKSGVKIYHGQFPEIYKTFREIYDQTMDSDNAADYYYFGDAFYESILYDLRNEAQMFWAELDGKVIATSIMIFSNGYMNYHLSGSLREYQNLAPSNLLLYEAALWGCSNGYKSLHLGGGVGSKEDSLFKFKSAFNRNEPHRFGIGKKIFLQDVYQNLEKINDQPLKEGFFPKYRG